MRNQSLRRTGFTLIEILVVLAILAVLMGLLVPAVQQARAAARRTQCLNQLRQIALATHNYQDAHSVLPFGSLVVGPSFGVGSGWGWGALILPFAEQSAIYSRIDFNIGTAVDANRAIIIQPIPYWICPADISPDRIRMNVPGHSPVDVASGNYCANESTMSGLSAVRFRDITDGLSNTVLVGERGWNPDPLARPITSAWCGSIAERSISIFDSIPFVSLRASEPINQLIGSPSGFSSYHAGGAQFALADGSARFFSESMDGDVFEALGTIAGGETVSF